MSRRPWTEAQKARKVEAELARVVDPLCMDCRSDTFASEEYYMLRFGLWRSINARGRGMLCLACVERRLRRSLERRDFTDAPVNQRQALKCPALAQRLERVVPRNRRIDRLR